MRYVVEDRELEPEESMALHRVVLEWAARKGERFVMRLVPEAYDDSEALARLKALGHVREDAASQRPQGFLRTFIDRFSRPRHGVEVSGRLDEAFMSAFREQTAPPGAIAGDLSPAEDVLVHAGDRVLYASYDYGRTQVLELTEQELNDLRGVLVNAGLDQERIVPAPPYITENDKERLL